MKSGKVPGIDNITADLLKADTDTIVNILHGLFNTIWEEKGSLRTGLEGLPSTCPRKGV